MGALKGSLRIFCIIVAGVVAFGLWRGFRLGETLVAAAMLAAVVLAGAACEADGCSAHAEIETTMATILLVEGDDQVRVLTGSFLEQQGHRVAQKIGATTPIRQ